MEAIVDGPAEEAVPASCALIVIKRTHPSQTVAGLAVLSHLANSADGCYFDELYALFLHTQGGLKGIHTTPQNLRGRLAHLVSKGYVLVCEGRGNKRRYRLGDISTLPSRPKAGAEAVPKVSVACPAGAETAYCGIPASARHHDVMYGPVYVPPRSATGRAGSLDFTRLASHGNRC